MIWAVIATELVLFLAGLSPKIQWYWYALPLVIFLALEIYGAAVISSQYHLRTFCEGPNDQKWVALTFDDGPQPETEPLLDLLQEKKVPATFFCIGNRIQQYPDIVRKITAGGHIVGNHSLTHSFWFDLKNKKEIGLELAKTEQLIEQFTGQRNNLFRPPYGVTTPAIAAACKTLNLRAIGWNVRSLDTSIRNHQEIFDRIVRRIAPGSIVLMHDSIPGIHLVVSDLIDHLHANGYQIVPIKKMLQHANV